MKTLVSVLVMELVVVHMTHGIVYIKPGRYGRLQAHVEPQMGAGYNNGPAWSEYYNDEETDNVNKNNNVNDNSINNNNNNINTRREVCDRKCQIVNIMCKIMPV